MEKLSFSSNWNNKLNCNCFSTIRIVQPMKYRIGDRKEITLKGQYLGIAELVHVTEFKFKQLTEGMALLDTGYSREECMNIITKMYPSYINQKGLNASFGFYIFKYVERQKQLV